MKETRKEAKSEKFELKQHIGLWSGVAITVSAMVGSGIFVTPSGVLQPVHGSVGVSLMMWVACGLVALSSSLCYCEQGSSLRASGEDFLYFKLAYGSSVAFVFVWCCVVVRPGAGATATNQIFSTYLLAPFFGSCGPPKIAVKLVAIITILVLHWLNYVSVKVSVKFEVVFTTAKYFALALIAIV